MATDTVSPRYFEDYVPGEEHEVGSISLSEDEIIDFARKYDPQDFHTNPELAAASPFGGLIASGWHTAAAVMRQLVDKFLDSASSLGSPGLDGLRWLAPVRPGDVLTIRVRILDTKRSSSKPGRGVMHSRTEVSNQDGVMVMTIDAISLLACRNAGGS